MLSDVYVRLVAAFRSADERYVSFDAKQGYQKLFQIRPVVLAVAVRDQKRNSRVVRTLFAISEHADRGGVEAHMLHIHVENQHGPFGKLGEYLHCADLAGLVEHARHICNRKRPPARLCLPAAALYPGFQRTRPVWYSGDLPESVSRIIPRKTVPGLSAIWLGSMRLISSTIPSFIANSFDNRKVAHRLRDHLFAFFFSFPFRSAFSCFHLKKKVALLEVRISENSDLVRYYYDLFNESHSFQSCKLHNIRTL